MKSPIRHIVFIIGILSVFTSFLFFGRQQDTYTILLLGGLATTGITYLIILFGRRTKKSKIIWTLILLFSIVLEQLTEPLLIKASFLIYVQTNHDNLEEINGLLINHHGTLHVYADSITTEDMELTDEETSRLMELRKSVDAYMISKSTTDIYYGLSGFLDIRRGILYSINGENQKQNLNVVCSQTNGITKIKSTMRQSSRWPGQS